MAELITLLIIIWIVGGIFWFVVSLVEWSMTREFPTLHSATERRQKALYVLKTPIWPLVALGMLGRAIGNLTHDVMRGND